MLSKENLERFKKKLTDEKKILEDQLFKIARPSMEHSGHWQPNYPAVPDTEAGHLALEAAEDSVEEYETGIALTQSMTNQIADIDLALERIKRGSFGKCDNCGREIPIQRLEVFPAAKNCLGGCLKTNGKG